jgi:hypothetical protein
MFACKLCNVIAKSVCNFRTHLATAKHIQNVEKHNSMLPKIDTTKDTTTNDLINDANKNSVSSTSKFACKNCNRELTSKYNLKRHFKTCQKTQSLLETINYNIVTNLSKQNNKLVVNDIITDISNKKVNATQIPNSKNITLNNLIPLPPKGIIYLIQPVELINTNRYKLGCSGKTSLDRCLTGYKKGSRYIYIQECFEPYKLETKLKLEFKNKFTLIGGTEYFAGDERQMKKIFNEITDSHDTSYDIFYNSTLPNLQNTEIPEMSASTNLLLA